MIIKFTLQYVNDVIINYCRSNPYLEAVHEMTHILINRNAWILLRLDPIFYLTPLGFRFRRACRIAHEYSRSIIAQRRTTLEKQDANTVRIF